MRKNPYADTPMEEQPRPNAALLRPKVIKKRPSGTVFAGRKPVVTVVTAVFNAIKDGREKEFLQCMDSVQAQTGVAIEHLIIDGASSDGTVDLIKNYQNEKVEVRLLSEPDAGIYDAMNRGIWLARGKYVIFLNSDDFYSNPAGLAESVKALEESGADFSYSPVCVLDEETGEPVDHPTCHPDVNTIFVEMPFCHQSMLFLRKVMLEINGFDLRYGSAGDYDSILRLVFTGHRACFVPTRFATFRLGGFSFVYKEQSYKEVSQIYSRHYAENFDVDLSSEDARKVYLSKQCPIELKQRQFALAQAAFGSEVRFLHQQKDELWLDDDLLQLKNSLHSLKCCKNIFCGIPVFFQLLFSIPATFCKFLRIYFRYRIHGGKCDAGKKACDELLARLQAERLQSGKQQKTLDGPNHPNLDVSIRDFWSTTGLYMNEPWGAWTGKILGIYFNLPKDYLHHSLTAQVYIGGFVYQDSPRRIVDITVNGQKVCTLSLENFMPQKHSFTIPAEAVTKTAMYVNFIADKTFSSKALGTGEDTRELGMSFREISIRKADV